MNTTVTTTSEKRLIGLPEVKRKTGLGKTAIYEGMARGDFPKAVKIGTAARWVEAEIDGWIDAQIERRDQQVAA